MGAQFWWFYDVIAIAAVLVCIFLTVKKGLMKAIVSLVGYILSVIIAMSVSASFTTLLYNRIIMPSNVKKLDSALQRVDISGEIATYINTLGYNVIVDTQQLNKIFDSGKDIDSGIYKYINNINSKKVDEKGIFITKLHEGYAIAINRAVSRELNEFAAEAAAEAVRNDPEDFHNVLTRLGDPDNKRPAAEYIAENYIAAPYKSMVRMIVMLIFLAIMLLVTILIARAAGKTDIMEAGLMRHTFCGLIGIFKGVIIIMAIAVIVRLYVLLGSNKMMFFNTNTIENSYIFKYFYEFIADL